MEKIYFSLVLALLLSSSSVSADSTDLIPYAGIKEWKSPSLGEEPEGESVKVANVDNDSNLEIIAIGGDGSIHIFEHDGTTYREEWRSQILALPLGDLAIGDLDSDGIMEIVVSTMEEGNTRFFVFGFNGVTFQQEWQSKLFPGDGYEGLSLYTVDTDSDGSPEIVVTSDEGHTGYAWIYDYDGTTYQEEWASGLLDQFAVIELYGLSDTDGDGLQEIVFAGTAIHIVGWDVTGYQLEWKSELLGGWIQCIVGDVNGDATTEIVAAIEERNIRIYSFDGSTYVLKWESADIEASTGQIGDVDNDGIQEIAVGSFSGEIYIFGYDGSSYQLEWQTATPSPYAYVYVEKIEDFDGQGGLEILVQELTDEDSSDETGYCDVFTYDDGAYRLLWRNEKIDSYFGGLLEPAGDVDNDGIIEEVRNANNEDKYYPYSFYVIGPAKQILNQTFTEGLPDGWSIIDGYSDGQTWTSTNPGNRSSSNWTGTFLIVDSDSAGTVDMDEELITHTIDCSDYVSVWLRFNHEFGYYEDEICDVDVRVSSGYWQNVMRYQGANASGQVELDLSSIAGGQPDVQIRWRYYNANYELYWGIDDVEICGVSGASPNEMDIGFAEITGTGS